MIIDAQAQFSSAQAITASAASTNVYDTGAAADVGNGEALRFYCSLTEAFNTLTSLDFILQSSTDNSTFVDHYKVNKLLAALVINADIDLPPAPTGLNRYVRLYYTVNGTNPTTGKISSGIVLNRHKNVATTDFA